MEDAEGTNGRRPKFSAFLSYSHADASAVRKLHSQLESYRLPRELGEVGALNEMSGRLGRVFRDREDLSAAENLSDAVTAALDQSEVLVVVCSPEAKASKWVGQEIAYFRERRPGKPILAAIVRGEPEEAFPDALTEGGAEPLAADLRREGDGWKLGFLKVVSGIAGVPLDALVQRDSQRQTRRVMAITGVSVLAALVMAIMTTVAIQSRNEAQFQQAEAEGLIEYMLTDLRDDLEGVGRLDVMDEVNHKALAFYRAQGPVSNFDDDQLERRSRVIEAMGRDLEQRRQFEEALELYIDVHGTSRELLDRQPNNPRRILKYAWTETRLAIAGVGASGQKATKSRLIAVSEMLDGIREWGVDQIDWWSVYALANGNLCASSVLSGKPSLAGQKHCEESILAGKTLGRMTDSLDADYDLAFHYYWASEMALLFSRQHDWERYRKEALQLSEAIVDQDPNNSKFLRQQMEILGARESDGTTVAQSDVRRAISIAVVLLEREPADNDVRERLAIYREKVGE